MKQSKIRVGIVGLRAEQSWAAVAHLPALGQLTDQYEIRGVVNSTPESSRVAAQSYDIPIAFGSIEEMALSEEIDLIVVTTRVSLHYDAVKTILSHGKHIYCEWPLGRTLKEAEELASIARERSLIAVAGTQSRVAAAIRELASLIKNNYIGTILSSSIRGWVATWGDTISDIKNEEYLRKEQSGADLLTIPFAHTLAAVCDVLGDINGLSAVIHTRFPKVRALDSGQFIHADAPDYISLIASLGDDTPFSIEYKGGQPVYGEAFVWEIEGTKGTIIITAPTGYTQLADFTIRVYTLPDQQPQVIKTADTAEPFGPATNVKEIYQRIASDIVSGTSSAPSFEDAVMLHRLIDHIRLSSKSRQWVNPAVQTRSLPNLS
ncbi:Gfo/Idh/MocA family oxidoreductase [Dyadobacter sp. LJ53]|uniref:Gfo/Idh/MocA family protein n=1 Tax=Dyadobacter chenwenxiniae TaxID=2906456 RepID=UPI001F2820D2|nr:Gfo/Idh/MocA family oxidoreductase [Dyadobacter chenwenxiniae]MCF0049311.1 Gfo/Idh/MocA family oxidoreductase [Dyadobacter chenwenxiniae]